MEKSRVYFLVFTMLIVIIGVFSIASAESDIEANKELIRTFIQAERDRDYVLLRSLLTDDFVRHGSSPPDVVVTSGDDYVVFLQGTAAEFPDYANTVQMMVAEDDLVAAYATFNATYAGNGEAIEFDFMAFWRIEDGKIAEVWIEWNDMVLLPQMGLMPPMETEALVTTEDIIGTWDWQLGRFYFQFREDGTYRASTMLDNLNSDQPQDIGNFTVEDGVLTLESGENSRHCSEGDVGIYDLSFNDAGQLEFLLQSDACSERRAPSLEPQPFELNT